MRNVVLLAKGLRNKNVSVGGFDFHMLVKIIKASALVIRKILLSFSFYAFFLAEIGRANFFFFFTI